MFLHWAHLLNSALQNRAQPSISQLQTSFPCTMLRYYGNQRKMLQNARPGQSPAKQCQYLPFGRGVAKMVRVGCCFGIRPMAFVPTPPRMSCPAESWKVIGGFGRRLAKKWAGDVGQTVRDHVRLRLALGSLLPGTVGDVTCCL